MLNETSANMMIGLSMMWTQGLALIQNKLLPALVLAL